MNESDRVIVGRRVITTEGERPAAIHIRGGIIQKVTAITDVPAGFPVEDAGDAVVLPGAVDTHVHVNEPGRTEWEGFGTATEAAAAGGVTTVVDMPLNSIPATVSVDAVLRKVDALGEQCFVDVGLWGGAVPGNAGQLRALLDAGVLGFKCFLVDSGVAEFPPLEESGLAEALRVLAGTGAPLLVHAEVPGPLEAASIGLVDDGSYDAYLRSRPRAAEDEAIALLLRYVELTRARAHVVHLSSASALSILARARDAGLPLTAETAPHYLTFESESVPPGATEYKCAPPIREHTNREELWRGLGEGLVSMVVTDHSPCTPALKRKDEGRFDGAWGGIASLQFGVSALWTEASARGFSLLDLTRWTASAPAELAGLSARKGFIAVGKDADLVFFAPDERFEVTSSIVRHRHKLTPYDGRTLRGVVRRTYLRGEPIFDRGQVAKAPRGAWLRRLVWMDLSDLVDLADERLGGAVLYANDDFFAPKENLLKPQKPVFLPHEYTDRGKWMDGWESRRKRVSGHDECIVRLGLPGKIRTAVVDTAFFRGNYPDRCALEGCFARSDASLAALQGPEMEWFPLLTESKLKGDSENVFTADERFTVSHVRLRIFPDGGVARLRLYGEVVPDFRALGGAGNELDVAALEAGGRVLTCSDMFFGPKHNLVLPGRSLTMEGGWETKRRRGLGHDWVIVALTGPASVARIEVDTNHFKGNYPDTCSIDAWDARGTALTAEGVPDWAKAPWKELLPRTKLEAHTRHFFVEELAALGPVTHLRLNVFPDGGVSRLRVHGTLTDEGRTAQGLAALEAATPARLRRTFETCCGARAWVEKMVEGRPFADVAALFATSDEAFSRLRDEDWREAFAHHPRIGESRAAKAAAAEADARRHSEGEQAGMRGAGEALLQTLREGNEAYERKFGFLFLVCATGKSAEELVSTLEARLGRDAATELATAKEEQRAIARLRLEKLLRP